MKIKQRIIKVNKGEKVSCPIKYYENWNLHPRVYIDLKDKESNTCPYCGTTFEIKQSK